MSAAAVPPRPVAIVGCTGRMGRALVTALPEFPQLVLGAAITNPGHEALGLDSGLLASGRGNGVRISDNLEAALREGVGAGHRPGLVIDFSSAEATAHTIAACRAARVPLLIGTTGFGADIDAVAGVL